MGSEMCIRDRLTGFTFVDDAQVVPFRTSYKIGFVGAARRDKLTLPFLRGVGLTAFDSR